MVASHATPEGDADDDHLDDLRALSSKLLEDAHNNGVAVRGTLVRDADTPTEIAELRAERDESARQLAEATEKNARLASKLEVLRVRIDAALRDAQARVRDASGFGTLLGREEVSKRRGRSVCVHGAAKG